MATLWNGEQEETLETFLWNGSELYPATDKVFPYGYRTYDDMTSRSMFYVGHRGCSDNRPEMSMRAYTDAAFWGVGALEFSARRTSDGVWFGMHDATMLRINGVDINPNTLTWEQVQAYQITLGPGAPEPFVRLEDVLDAYGSTHVMFLDPKYDVTSNRSEFFDIIEDHMPANRVVIKWSGGLSGLAADARARGFSSWGYYYQEDFDNNTLQTTGAEWDMIGMARGADQAAWDEAKSFGVPVLGHIIRDASEAAVAIDKGADGLMCANVFGVVPEVS